MLPSLSMSGMKPSGGIATDAWLGVRWMAGTFIGRIDDESGLKLGSGMFMSPSRFECRERLPTDMDGEGARLKLTLSVA